MAKTEGRAQSPIDTFVGLRIKKFRIMKGVGQQELASMIGVSFQQIQKYEKAINRVSAGRLWDICNALDINLYDMFYDDGNAVFMSTVKDDIKKLQNENMILKNVFRDFYYMCAKMPATSERDELLSLFVKNQFLQQEFCG